MGELVVRTNLPASAATPLLIPVHLRITCSTPIVFSHVIRASGDGPIRVRLPAGTCLLEATAPVEVEGHRPSWKGSVEILADKLIGFTLSIENARARENGRDTAEEVTALSIPPSPPGNVTAERGYEGYVDEPQALVEVYPSYFDANTKSWYANFSLSGVVGIDGFIRDVSVGKNKWDCTPPDPETCDKFRDAAVQAFSQWYFRPATLSGKPVAHPIARELSVSFSPHKDSGPTSSAKP